MPVEHAHVHGGSARRAPEGAAVGESPRAALSLEQRHVRDSSAGRASEDYAVGAGATLGYGEENVNHNNVITFDGHCHYNSIITAQVHFCCLCNNYC